MTLDWDKWRADYDTMTYQDQRDFYDEAFVLYPKQEHFTLSRAFEFLDHTSGGSVTEIGGWNGALALKCLERYPLISSWTNIEISGDAAKSSLVTDGRFSIEVPDDFIWNVRNIEGDIFLATHFIEHIKGADFRKLAFRLMTEWVYFEAPLLNDGETWEGYDGNHISELQWDDVTSIMSSNWYTLVSFEKIGGTGYAVYQSS